MATDLALRVRLLLDAHTPRQWHLDLLQRISATPFLTAEAEWVEGGAALPGAAERLFKVEAAAYRLAPAAASRRAAAAAFDRLRPGPAAPDLVLDLLGGPVRPLPAGCAGARRWRLTFDGVPGEAGLLAAFLSRHAPVAEIREGDRLVLAARIGTEHQGVMCQAFEDGSARTVTVVMAALDTLQSPDPGEAPAIAYDPPRPGALSGTNVSRQAASTLGRALLRKAYGTVFATPHWRVGWRRLEGGADLIDLRRHPQDGWNNLPDDGRRFYADPFPIEHQGRTFLFVEDFEHALGKGVISVVEFGPEGPRGAPVPVLELPCHLSYPFVFHADGAVWMIPETSGAGTVELFRATDFPGGWVKEATLLAGVVASDATLFERDGRWWMFATVRDGKAGAFSDVLHLWSAPSFRGPFLPHAHNPVLIDIASARPAGRLVERGGRLWRPVQDCRAGYGAALGIARVDRLDDSGFAQTVETILRAGPEWPGRRFHTLNRTAAFEFIDGSAPAPRRF